MFPVSPQIDAVCILILLIAAALMLQTYKSAPDGLQNQNEEPQFKTSRELQYMVRESCEPTVAEISQSMIRMKFDGISKAGTYYWKLYERQV